MAEARVDVAIVTYGAASDLATAVAAVRAQGEVVGRVLVVDNASPDGTADVARSLAGVDVVANQTNTGYAAAMNQAYARTGAPYLLSLNADAVLEPGYVDALVRALDRDGQVGGATGLLVRPDGSVDSTGIVLTAAYWAAERDDGARSGDASTGAPFGVSGAAALWRRAMLDEFAPTPWWPWLFVYWDDVELCWRARRRGWTFAYVPEGRAEHRRGAASGEPTFTEAQSLRNRLATVARHRGRRGVFAPQSLLATGLTVTRLGVRHPGALRAAHPWAAVRAGLAARRHDGAALSHDAGRLAPHPWRSWVGAQLRTGTAERAGARPLPRP